MLESERITQLNKAYEAIGVNKKRKDDENLIDSAKWEPIVSEMSINELKQILEEKRGEYNPSFLIAADNEIQKREY